MILTHGHDPTVESFLRAAHKKRSFQVVVAETAPGGDGRLTAIELAEAGIHTTLIADSGVFAMMARVNKAPLLPPAHHPTTSIARLAPRRVAPERQPSPRPRALR